MKSNFSYTTVTNRTYPYLGIAVNGEGTTIVLFSARNTGTVVGVSNASPNKLGAYSESWAESLFMVFGGEVKLSNE